ncbi:hypothetical protein QE152_g9413 [Popillia japonica]|uniref:Uncharacterized protein n=1 Tax=Popillia japonica TaxID=7064 RepID=A0AAW1M175_POPJA
MRYMALKSKIENCELPKPGEGFKEYPALCKKTVYSLEKAEELITKALDTSTLENDTSDSDNAEIESNLSTESSVLQQLPVILSRSNASSTIADVMSSQSPIIMSDIGSDATSEMTLTSTENESNRMIGIENQLKLILRDLKAIQFEIKDMKTAISNIDTHVKLLTEQMILRSDTGSVPMPIVSRNNSFQLPANTMAEFIAIDEACTNEASRSHLTAII